MHTDVYVHVHRQHWCGQICIPHVGINQDISLTAHGRVEVFGAVFLCYVLASKSMWSDLDSEKIGPVYRDDIHSCGWRNCSSYIWFHQYLEVRKSQFRDHSSYFGRRADFRPGRFLPDARKLTGVGQISVMAHLLPDALEHLPKSLILDA